MACSKVKQPWKKPLKWWYHKILCEIGWNFLGGSNGWMYHRHLKKMLALGFNLYGEKYLQPKCPATPPGITTLYLTWEFITEKDRN